LGIILAHGPYYTEYAQKYQREKSFCNWPGKQTVDNLASAGFFYTGRLDRAACHTCGIVLGDWKDDDDPWQEHAKHSTNCSFVLLHKGREFVAQYDCAEEDEIAEDTVDAGETITCDLAALNLKSEEKKCVTCMENAIQILTTPCGHFVSCKDCVTSLKRCALCRRQITGYIRAFTA